MKERFLEPRLQKSQKEGEKVILFVETKAEEIVGYYNKSPGFYTHPLLPLLARFLSFHRYTVHTQRVFLAKIACEAVN